MVWTFVHKQPAWLVRKDLYGKAGLMKVAVVGGLVPAARLRAADERYDGLSQDAWQKGLRLRRQCSTGYGNAPATRRVEFSAQQNNGARKQRNSIKMLVLDARLVTLTQSSNGNLSATPDLHVIMSLRGLVSFGPPSEATVGVFVVPKKLGKQAYF